MLAIINKPYEFLIYGFNDVLLLEQILETKVKLFNDLLTEIFKIDSEFHFTRNTLPLTVGSIVNSVFLKYLNNNIFKNDKVLQLSMKKNGILNTLHKTNSENVRQFKKLMGFRSLNELYNFASENPKEFQDLCILLNKNVFRYEAWQLASIKVLTDRSENTSSHLLSLRTGGRTLNERPYEYCIEIGGDVDILGAYGNELNKWKYPIGKPRMYVQSSNDLTKYTLKQFFFLKKKSKKTCSFSLFTALPLRFAFFTYREAVKKRSTFGVRALTPIPRRGSVRGKTYRSALVYTEGVR